MEGVKYKLIWEVFDRVDKHIPTPIPRPVWRIGELGEIIAPIEDQLWEDTKWKE